MTSRIDSCDRHYYRECYGEVLKDRLFNNNSEIDIIEEEDSQRSILVQRTILKINSNIEYDFRDRL